MIVTTFFFTYDILILQYKPGHIISDDQQLCQSFLLLLVSGLNKMKIYIEFYEKGESNFHTKFNAIYILAYIFTNYMPPREP